MGQPTIRMIGATALALAAASCQEHLTAPSNCPEFCPATEIRVVDSVLADAIVNDSTYRGFVPGHRAEAMQIAADSVPLSWGMYRFVQFGDTLVASDGSATGPVVAIDSFRLTVRVRRKAVVESDLTLVLHRLPVSVDSLTTFADAEPYFQDSTVIATVTVPADSIPGDSLSAMFPGDALPQHLGSDSSRAAIGVSLRAPPPAFVDLGTFDGGQSAELTRFSRLDVGGGNTAAGIDARPTTFDGYVVRDLPPLAGDELAVGGVPAARVLLRVVLPPAIVDSSDIVRATLVLVPTGPVFGAPWDTLELRADILASDVGPKSPVIVLDLTGEPPGTGIGRIAVGSADTLRVDVTPHLRAFQRDTARPHTLSLRSAREAQQLGEARFLSSRSAAQAPVLHLTFVPLGREVRR